MALPSGAACQGSGASGYRWETLLPVRPLSVLLAAADTVRQGGVAVVDAGDLRIRNTARATGSAVAEASLDLMERRMIFEALEKVGGHQQRAADQLGISRRTLSRKLKQYQMETVGAL